MLLMFLACVHSPEARKPSVVQPRVPSLQSAVYVHHDAFPTDALVAKVWGQKLDESLSGAAGALAMRLIEDRPLDRADLRWRAVLAGYPWPVAEARTQRVAVDEVPQDLLVAAQAATGRDLGLVRARGHAGDQWVLLIGARRGELPAFAREAHVGSRLILPGYGLLAVPPDGVRREARDALALDQAGEWLIGLYDEQGEVTTFPLYVDRATPQGPPFGGAASGESAGDLDEELLVRLDTLDQWYRRDAAERDSLLDGVARARLRSFVAGQVLADDKAQLAAAGFFEGTTGACRAATVADCLDVMWWSVSGHAALGSSWGSIGMAVTPVSGGVAIVVATADREDNALPL